MWFASSLQVMPMDTPSGTSTPSLFMVYGYDRIPIVTWLRRQADESLLHVQEAREMITHLDEHSSLSIGEMLETR